MVHLMGPLSPVVQLDDEHTPCSVRRTMVISDLKHLGTSILNFRVVQGLRRSWFSGKHPPQQPPVLVSCTCESLRQQWWIHDGSMPAPWRTGCIICSSWKTMSQGSCREELCSSTGGSCILCTESNNPTTGSWPTSPCNVTSHMSWTTQLPPQIFHFKASRCKKSSIPKGHI